MTRTIHPVILCGGSGTRLWPLSRQSYPKQFAALVSEETLFQACARRLGGAGFAAPTVVTADPFRFIVTEQLEEIGVTPRATLIEPEPKNTAPAILAAALHLEAEGGLMLVAPSDHVIPDPEAFRSVVAAACPAAEEGRIVTFGIRPDRPETGYGYLRLAGKAAEGPTPLAAFVEKPDAARAEAMVADGAHLWNAGIFLFSVQTIVAAFETHAPDLLRQVRAAMDAAQPDLGFTRIDPGAWSAIAPVSIDYAIMEKAADLSVMPYDGGWSDLGSWAAVWQQAGPDGDGNVTAGHAEAIECTGSLLRSEGSNQVIVGIGLTDIVAVAMPDAVIVAPRGEAQRVGEAVTRLRADGARQATEFPRDHRPWGWFESLALGPRFQVKRIVVKPGAALSLQSHHHRSEHWIVVEGTAKVTIGEETRLVAETESVHIPLGAKHRLENPGKVPMVLIEVQTGPYLGEDDIVRYEDLYARG